MLRLKQGTNFKHFWPKGPETAFGNKKARACELQQRADFGDAVIAEERSVFVKEGKMKAWMRGGGKRVIELSRRLGRCPPTAVADL
ncbi:hypothetical protein TNCV_678451 [Trichonephila clavipes]|nr:hypothetical protein TNCV_678451 [Trichonephila clavipes]